jgi:hypothetical protein
MRTGASWDPIQPMKSAHLSPFMQRPRAFTRLQRRVARHRLGGSFLLGRLAGAKTVEFDHRRSRDWLHEQVAHCPDQRVDPVRREPRHLPIEIHCERAHLIFEGRRLGAATPASTYKRTWRLFCSVWAPDCVGPAAVGGLAAGFFRRNIAGQN